MATKLEELFIELNAKNDKLIKGLNEAVSKVQKSGKKIKNETEKVGKSSEKSILKIPAAAEVMAGVLGGNLVLGSIQKVTRFMGEAFTGVKDLSRGIAEINTLLPKNGRLTEENGKQFLKFSSLYNQDIRSETKAFYDIVSSGVSDTAKAMEVLEVANEAAVGGLTQVSTAADVITSSMNSYAQSGLTARDISDSLFKAVKEGKTTFGELASSIGAVAPIASAAGLKFGELTGIIAALTKAGLSTSEASTGVRAILTGLIKPTEEATKFAKQLGLEFNTTALRAKGLTGFIADMAEKTGGSEEALAKLFPNVRALGPVLQIVRGDLQAFNKTISETSNTANDTAEAAKIIRESFDFKLDQTSRSVKNLAVSFLDFLKPAMEFTLDSVNRTFRDIGLAKGILKAAFGKESLQPISELKEEIGSLEEKLSNLNEFAPSGIREALEEQLAGAKIKLRGIEFPEGEAGKFIQDIEDDILGRDPVEIPFEPKVRDAALGGEGESIVVPIEIQIQDAKEEIKKFTELEKEAAEAGQELAESLIESGEKLAGRASLLKAQKEKELIDDEEFFDAKEEMIIENFEREFDLLQEANEQKLISKADLLAAENELELQQTAALTAVDADRAKARKKIKDKADKEDLKNREAFLSTAATLARSENSILNGIGKAAAITQIAIATPPAIASSFKFGASIGGPILGGVFAGIAGAAMAAQAASVAGVALQTGLTEVPAGFPNDTFAARLTSGERVVNGPQNQDLVETMALMRQFIAGNQSSGQNFIFQIQTLIGDDEIAKRQLTGMLNDFLSENGGVLRTA